MYDPILGVDPDYILEAWPKDYHPKYRDDIMREGAEALAAGNAPPFLYPWEMDEYDKYRRSVR